jgi:hypothetical protein
VILETIGAIAGIAGLGTGGLAIRHSMKPEHYRIVNDSSKHRSGREVRVYVHRRTMFGSWVKVHEESSLCWSEFAVEENIRKCKEWLKHGLSNGFRDKNIVYDSQLDGYGPLDQGRLK